MYLLQMPHGVGGYITFLCYIRTNLFLPNSRNRSGVLQKCLGTNAVTWLCVRLARILTTGSGAGPQLPQTLLLLSPLSTALLRVSAFLQKLIVFCVTEAINFYLTREFHF